MKLKGLEQGVKCHMQRRQGDRGYFRKRLWAGIKGYGNRGGQVWVYVNIVSNYIHL